MSNVTSKVTSGAMIALSAAALIMAGSAFAGTKADSNEAAMVKCGGVNSCKGSSECKTSENACKGQNACKGHGFLTMSASDCKAKGGVFPNEF